MTAMPVNPVSILTAIDEAIVGATDVRPRPYLDFSQLGHECDRRLWLSFRWASTPSITGTALRRSRHLDDARHRLVEWLELAGATVEVADANGQPFRFIDLGGHLQGVIDGVVSGIPEAPVAYHLLMLDALQNQAFNAVAKHGLFSEMPRRYYEAQVFMAHTALDRTLYLAVNTNDDRLYSERIALDKNAVALMRRRADHIVGQPEPPAKLSDDKEFFQCKRCDFAGICHGSVSAVIEGEDGEPGVAELLHPLADVNCRTCLHSTPEADGNWSCGRWDAVVPTDAQAEGCEEHRFIPALITFGVPVDADMTENFVVYEMEDGRTFVNGAHPAYSSHELRVIAPELIGDAVVESVKTVLDGRVADEREKAFVDSLGSEEYDDDIPY